MPNHTSTIFRVMGTPKRLDEFIKKAKGDESIFSFNSFVPCPKELHEVRSPVYIISEDEYAAQETIKSLKIAEAKIAGKPLNEFAFTGCKKITAKMEQELRDKFGFNNWYDWQCNNWGTKWDCYDVSEEWLRYGNPNDDMQENIQCHYQTAWSPATAALQSISEQFPELSFYHAFADEGGGFLGYESIQDGEVLENVEVEWDSEAGEKLRVEVGQTTWEDIAQWKQEAEEA